MPSPTGPLRALGRRVAQARSGDDAGFSIVEVMVALAILVVVSAGAIVGAMAGTQAGAQAGDRITGINIAQSDLDQARANPSPVPTAYSTAPAATNAPTYSVTRTVTTILPASATPGATCPAGGERHIAVVVRWRAANGVIRLDSVVAC